MLTIEDLRNPKRKSGFDHVGSANSGPRWQTNHDRWRAEKKGATSKGSTTTHFRGPTRRVPEEAAQDYCDYVNGQQKMLTVEDIRNSNRKSGFDHVGMSLSGSSTCPFGARSSSKVTASGNYTPSWHGPRRATAVEAAQDYCNYMNEQATTVVAPKLKTISHVVTSIVPKMSDEERELRKKVKDEQEKRLSVRDSSVYLIAEDTTPLKYVKVGYSFTPDRRVANLQTSNPRPLKLLGTIPGGEAEERALHAKYIADNVLYEWFTVSPGLLAEFNVVPESEEVKKEATNVTERKAGRSARKTTQREGLSVRGHRARSRTR